MFTACSDPLLPYLLLTWFQSRSTWKVIQQNKQKRPPRYFFLNLNLFPDLNDHESTQIFVPAQLRRQGRSRRRQILVEAEKLWTYMMKYYNFLSIRNYIDWLQWQHCLLNAGVKWVFFFLFFLGVRQIICGNPAKALHERRQKLGVCFSCILHIPAWWPP